MSGDLPPYSGNKAVCGKCGKAGSGQHHSTEWVPKGSYTARGSIGECLERRCFNCGYTWAEAVIG